MKAALTLAQATHFEVLLAMVSAFHAELGLGTKQETQRAAIEGLVSNIPHGSAYLIGPTRAPIGYCVISFGWSVEFGGLDAVLDELYIRPNVRGRGLASEVLQTLPDALAKQADLKAIHLEVRETDQAAARLYQRAGFHRRTGYLMMTRSF